MAKANKLLGLHSQRQLALEDAATSDYMYSQMLDEIEIMDSRYPQNESLRISISLFAESR